MSERCDKGQAPMLEHFRFLIDQSVDGIIVVDSEGRVRLANNAAARILRKPELLDYQFGYPAISETPVQIVVAPQSPEPTTAELRAAEIEWEGKDALLINLRDITHLLREQSKLQQSEERFRQLFENSGDAILITDDHGRVLHANGAACALFGYTHEKLLAMNVAEVAPLQNKNKISKEHLQAGGQGGRCTFARRDGATRITEYSTFALSHGQHVYILRDVTKRQSLEEQLRQAQKMEAVGRLAGGVAHDFNNLLTSIISFAGFVRDELPHSDPRRKDIGEVLRAADRAAGLTKQLLAFSRRQAIAPKHLNLRTLIGETKRLLSRLLGEDIEIVTIIQEDLWLVFIDPNQFHQVLMNLAVNARDAMPRGGRLTIEAENVRAPDSQMDRCVTLRVSDTGCGMPENVRARVFEPFFSTKEKDKGTGLGLSTVYGLITQAGGDITVQSAPGEGTTIEVRLPKSDGAMSMESELQTASIDFAGTEAILVVEDEPAVLRAATRILSRQGYTVLEASDGTEATKKYAKSDEQIDLLLCDVVMPGMDGRETAKALQYNRPHLRVLYMTGYTDNIITHHGVLKPGVQMIWKPFSEKALLMRIRQCLDNPAGGENE